jgi:ABC-type polysaccharide/polyol phosphate transport system ATPase subunit
MHRSGTSFCVRALHQHGIQLPPNLLPPAADNPEGFQESADLIALNDAILAAQGSLWDGSWPLQNNALTESRSHQQPQGLQRETKRLLQSWCSPAAHQLIALKDPRLCRTMPQISAALTPAWFRFGIAIVRNPAAVVGSIGYRDDMPPLKALALWLRHNLDIIELRQRLPMVSAWPLIRFEQLLEQPERTLQPALNLWREAGLELSLTPKEILQQRESPKPPKTLTDVPQQWLDLAQAFYQAMHQADEIGSVSETALEPVRELLDGSPQLSQRLLALEANRRDQLGQLLAQERRNTEKPQLLGEEDLKALENKQNDDEPAYVRLKQVCIDLRGREQRRSLKRLLTQQGRSGLRPLALDHLDLSIGHGERIGLLGHNGSGKTTLLRLLGDIYRPSSGQIQRDGPAMAPVIDQSLGFSQELTGLQLARYTHRLHAANLQSWPSYLEQLETFTELGEALSTPIKTWSLGMRTRLSFALITFRKVQGLALDEGLAAGDQWFQNKARKHLDQFIDAAGTLVLASHSEDLLRRYCTRGVILERGRLRYDGSLYRALQLYRGQLN